MTNVIRSCYTGRVEGESLWEAGTSNNLKEKKWHFQVLEVPFRQAVRFGLDLEIHR
jgi:hypothetical protein